MEKLVLLNFEGNVITVEKINENVFFAYDQTNEFVEELSKEGLMNFLSGDITIEDSLGIVWNYTDSPKDAKPHDIQLEIFLNDDPELTTVKILKNYFSSKDEILSDEIINSIAADFHCIFSEVSRCNVPSSSVDINKILYKYLK